MTRVKQVDATKFFCRTLTPASASKFWDQGNLLLSETGTPLARAEGIQKMLSKCANPSCSTPLIYLREGKIFRIDSSAKPAAAGPSLIKTVERIEHFWLCGPCSERLTLVFHPERGAQVKPKPTPMSTRAAAS